MVSSSQYLLSEILGSCFWNRIPFRVITIQLEIWSHIQIKQTNLNKNKLTPKHSVNSWLTSAPSTSLARWCSCILVLFLTVILNERLQCCWGVVQTHHTRASSSETGVMEESSAFTCTCTKCVWLYFAKVSSVTAEITPHFSYRN